MTFHVKSDSRTALEIIATNMYISNSTFSFNRIGRCLTIDIELSKTYHTLLGGAIFATQCSNITIVGSKFESNGAEIGGALFVSMGSNLKILNCTFIDNHVAVADSSVKDSYCSDPGTAKLYRISELQDFITVLVWSNGSGLMEDLAWEEPLLYFKAHH